MSCKNCITLVICRNELIRLLSEWYYYPGERDYNYIDVYMCYSRAIEDKCKTIMNNYIKHYKNLDIKPFVLYVIEQLSLGDVIKIEM